MEEQKVVFMNKDLGLRLAVVPAISNIAASPMAGFFVPADRAQADKSAFEAGTGEIKYLNFMPRDFDEGAAF